MVGTTVLGVEGDKEVLARPYTGEVTLGTSGVSGFRPFDPSTLSR